MRPHRPGPAFFLFLIIKERFGRKSCRSLLTPHGTLSYYAALPISLPAKTIRKRPLSPRFRDGGRRVPRFLDWPQPVTRGVFSHINSAFRKSKRGYRMSGLIERTMPHSAPENPAYSPKEVATLPTATGIIASICLLTILFCSVNAGAAGELGKARAADQDAALKASPKSARQLYSAGRELYWQERYPEAIEVFESAAAAPGELGPSDRKRLEDYLKRARMKRARRRRQRKWWPGPSRRNSYLPPAGRRDVRTRNTRRRRSCWPKPDGNSTPEMSPSQKNLHRAARSSTSTG